MASDYIHCDKCGKIGNNFIRVFKNRKSFRFIHEKCATLNQRIKYQEHLRKDVYNDLARHIKQVEDLIKLKKGN